MADDAKIEDGDNGRLRKTLKLFRKERGEESAARELLDEMQQNVDEAHARVRETERRLCQARGIHVLMGPRNWKTKQPQRQNLAIVRSRAILKVTSQKF